MHSLFLAYPFSDVQIHAAVVRSCAGLAEVRTADKELTHLHLLDKIERMMEDADVCLFDLTGYNVNVAVEFGLARGRGLAPLILFNPLASEQANSKTPDIFSDLRGIDSLRYSSYDELERELRLRLPGILRSQKNGSLHVPRLQVEIHTDRSQDGSCWLVGEIYASNAVPVERVQYTLGGYVGKAGKPTRIGSLVANQRHSVRIRYDHVGLNNAASGMECLVVEFADSTGRKYEQRGRLFPTRDGQSISYTFDGLGHPTRLESFNLLQPPLEDP